MGKTAKLPKTKCCVSKSRCSRCPIRMLKEGALPSGYGVHKRELVRIGADGRPLTGKAAKNAGGKVKKGELAAAMRKQKKSGKKAA